MGIPYELYLWDKRTENRENIRSICSIRLQVCFLSKNNVLQRDHMGLFKLGYMIRRLLENRKHRVSVFRARENFPMLYFYFRYMIWHLLHSVCATVRHHSKFIFVDRLRYWLLMRKARKNVAIFFKFPMLFVTPRENFYFEICTNCSWNKLMLNIFDLFVMLVLPLLLSPPRQNWLQETKQFVNLCYLVLGIGVHFIFKN